MHTFFDGGKKIFLLAENLFYLVQFCGKSSSQLRISARQGKIHWPELGLYYRVLIYRVYGWVYSFTGMNKEVKVGFS
jgi:hypothetical protein